MRYQRVKNVAWRRVGEETVIINLGRRRMLGVNQAGGAVWDALAGGAVVSAGAAAPFLADLEAEQVVERLVAGEGEAPIELAPEQAPAVVWREELHQFGGGCALAPGQSDYCSQNGPQMS